jgi:hypothetical protein
LVVLLLQDKLAHHVNVVQAVEVRCGGVVRDAEPAVVAVEHLGRLHLVVQHRHEAAKDLAQHGQQLHRHLRRNEHALLERGTASRRYAAAQRLLLLLRLLLLRLLLLRLLVVVGGLDGRVDGADKGLKVAHLDGRRREEVVDVAQRLALCRVARLVQRLDDGDAEVRQAAHHVAQVVPRQAAHH